MRKEKTFRESLLDTLAIIRTCLTSFWFWLPPLLMTYYFLQFYLVFIHPLLVLILPTFLAIYGLLLEEKELKRKYNMIFKRRKRKEVGEVVKEYLELLEREKRGKKNLRKE